jgi:RNA polymerase sigma-70 factor (family 1)
MSVKPLFDERTLLARLAVHDERAFRLLYEQYRKKVYTFSLRIVQSPELAEDVMQETFIKLWHLGEEAHTITNLEGWLRTLSRNSSLNILRRQAAGARADEWLRNSWQEGHNDTEETVILNDSRKILSEGIALLPPRQQLVYQLCEQQGLECDEVARKLDLSPLTVKSHLQLAVRSLRDHMQRHAGVAVALIIFGLK